MKFTKIKNNIGKIVDDPDDIIEGLATGDTVKELFRVNVSNDNGLVNVTTSVKSLKSVSYTHLTLPTKRIV